MTSYARSGIPKIIHQTWHSKEVPPEKGDPESWRRLNPEWEYRFWSDEDLHAFMQEHFADLLPLYDGYSRIVQKIDLARYCLLKHFGGNYADIDTRCVASLDPIAGDPRAVLCEEPSRHFEPALRRGLGRLFFNGCMASPPGHPLWDDVIALCRRMYARRDFDVLETTGPLILTAAVEGFAEPGRLALHSAHLFAGTDVQRQPETGPRHGPWGHLTFCDHLWQGSWYTVRRPSYARRKVARLRKTVHDLWPRRRVSLPGVEASVDRALLTRPIGDGPETPEIAILVPVRDGAATLEQNLDAILSLDYPKEKIRLYYGSGQSGDDTDALIDGFIKRHGATFGGMTRVALHRDGSALPRNRRCHPKHQLKRRAGIARARNDLLSAALACPAEWFLWLDADVIGLPVSLLRRLLAERAKIVQPDCVLVSGGPSYDLNAFLDICEPSRADYYRHVRGGLFQPPLDYWCRRHLQDLRYLERVPLDGVGGTALLVHADVHRAGLAFPEQPYRDLIETEGFGTLARDLGVRPIGLPRVEVVHHAS